VKIYKIFFLFILCCISKINGMDKQFSFVGTFCENERVVERKLFDCCCKKKPDDLDDVVSVVFKEKRGVEIVFAVFSYVCENDFVGAAILSNLQLNSLILEGLFDKDVQMATNLKKIFIQTLKNSLYLKKINLLKEFVKNIFVGEGKYINLQDHKLYKELEEVAQDFIFEIQYAPLCGVDEKKRARVKNEIIQLLGEQGSNDDEKKK
jgi:hypothetical protein